MSNNSIPGEPTVKGRVASAYEVPLTGARTIDETATLACWLVVSPCFHPFWSRWLIYCIHLRDIEGVKPAFKQFAEATHEFAIFSLNPEKYSNHEEGLPPPKGWGLMTPMDVMEHFTVKSDEEAINLTAHAIRAICDGRLSPDQDYRRHWANCIQTTARHYREGRHASA